MGLGRSRGAWAFSGKTVGSFRRFLSRREGEAPASPVCLLSASGMQGVKMLPGGPPRVGAKAVVTPGPHLHIRPGKNDWECHPMPRPPRPFTLSLGPASPASPSFSSVSQLLPTPSPPWQPVLRFMEWLFFCGGDVEGNPVVQSPGEGFQATYCVPGRSWLSPRTSCLPPPPGLGPRTDQALRGPAPKPWGSAGVPSWDVGSKAPAWV